MKRRAGGFTSWDLLACVSTLVLILALVLPAMKQRWNADGLSVSLSNVRQINMACASYRLDNMNRLPFRASAYSSGTISGGWDTWSFAGKNASSYWASQTFDEHAYTRPLNPYLHNRPIPKPAGYINTGVGPSWTLSRGTITAQQRASFQLWVMKSPGDIATRQRSWPTATAGVSGYDDVGTSYLTNFKWWDTPGLPSSFSQRFDAGTQRIRSIPPQPDPTRPFVWVHDQTADVVANFSNPNYTIKGEFGGRNKSVMGFLTGDAAYLEVIPGAMNGPNYSFGFPIP